MDLDEYNSISETLYLGKSEANRKRLQSAMDEMNSGQHFSYELIEE